MRPLLSACQRLSWCFLNCPLNSRCNHSRLLSLVQLSLLLFV
jgi:hypothetical protein